MKVLEWFKSVYKNPFYVLLSYMIVFYAACNVFNYYHLYSFTTNLPMIDVVSQLEWLQTTDVVLRDNRLDGLIQEFYIRNEPIYALTFQTQTIVAIPNVKISLGSLSIEFVTGFYDFTTSDINLDKESQLNSVFIKALSDNIFNFKNQTINQFIQDHVDPLYLYREPIISTHFHNFDTWRLLTHISNLGFLFSSIMTTVSVCLLTAISSSSKPIIFECCLAFWLVTLISNLIFQCLHLSPLIAGQVSYINAYFVRNFVIMVLEIIANLYLSYKMYQISNSHVASLGSKDDFFISAFFGSKSGPNLLPEKKITKSESSGLKSLSVLAAVVPEKSSPIFNQIPQTGLFIEALSESSRASSIYPESIPENLNHESLPSPYNGPIKSPTDSVPSDTKRVVTAPVPYNTNNRIQSGRVRSAKSLSEEIQTAFNDLKKESPNNESSPERIDHDQTSSQLRLTRILARSGLEQ